MIEFLNIAGGRTPATSANPMVLLTRGLDDARQAYRFLALQLTMAGYRAAVMDMRGHGETNASWPSLTRSSVAGDILALIDHRGGPGACGQLLRRYPGGCHEAVGAPHQRPRRHRRHRWKRRSCATVMSR